MSLINVGNENGNINAVFIFEIIGKPKEYLTEALSNIIGEIDKENGINVIEKKINEPIVLKDQEDFFTTFAEVEVEAEKIMDMIVLMFKYMPAHVEVTNPGEISLSNNSWSEVLSELTRRLHAYDEVARIMQTEKGILEKKLRELIRGIKSSTLCSCPKWSYRRNRAVNHTRC